MFRYSSDILAFGVEDLNEVLEPMGLSISNKQHVSSQHLAVSVHFQSWSKGFCRRLSIVAYIGTG